MGVMNKPLLLLLLLFFLIASIAVKPSVVEARPLSLLSHQGNNFKSLSLNFKGKKHMYFCIPNFFFEKIMIKFPLSFSLQFSSYNSGAVVDVLCCDDLQGIRRFQERLELFASVVMELMELAQVHGRILALICSVFLGNHTNYLYISYLQFCFVILCIVYIKLIQLHIPQRLNSSLKDLY